MSTNTRTIGLKDHTSGNEIVISDDGAASILIEDNTDQIVNGLMTEATGGPQFTGADVVIDTYVITMAGGHTILANDFIVVAEDDRLYQGKVLSVSVNDLTMDTPFDYGFPQAGTSVFKVINDLSVNGSVTPRIFTIGTPTSVIHDVHFTGLRINLTDASPMDDGTFGSLAALTKGVVFRQVKEDGRIFNFVNVKTNGELGLAFDHKNYTAKGPGGENSVEFTWLIGSEDGVIINIEPGDEIQAIIQDDLSSLSSFKVWAFGHLNE